MDDDETEFLEKVEMVRLIKKFIHSMIHRFCIKFYVAVEVEPYENGGGRAMEERQTCSGWKRKSREKNIPIFGIRDRYEML